MKFFMTWDGRCKGMFIVRYFEYVLLLTKYIKPSSQPKIGVYNTLIFKETEETSIYFRELCRADSGPYR